MDLSPILKPSRSHVAISSASDVDYSAMLESFDAIPPSLRVPQG